MLTMVNILVSASRRQAPFLRRSYERERGGHFCCSTQYTYGSLDAEDLHPEPLVQLEKWIRQAASAALPDPEAMALATADSSGTPSARMVLLKGLDPRGLTFFTNYESQKSRELDENPHAAAVFYWPLIERQVRVSGGVERLTREESQGYFQSRPREAQLGAWASQQSRVIATRGIVEEELRRVTSLHEGREVPTPPFWGGWRIVPVAVEFWQGRPSRLHDRLRYVRSAEGWRIERLSP